MDREARERQEADSTDELLTVLLDDLGPAVQWYRDEVARRLGLSSAELLCLDVCRRHGPISKGRLGERLGLTRSAVAKMLRRLEGDGHLVRDLPRGREQEIHVRLRPHPHRDAVLADLRADMRRAVKQVVADFALREQRHSLAAGVVVRLGDTFFEHARALAEATAWRRILAERRARREADPARPWWERY
ncbi:MarR family transcriptional regulator [Actinomycetospora rhizophila]|uniref:MarR family transcriptional regulator n=1 Tax=Actinomycetospora rhizophila TaxID=1416876 RepID=A0ABV9ZFA4_9PSEU